MSEAGESGRRGGGEGERGGERGVEGGRGEGSLTVEERA